MIGLTVSHYRIVGQIGAGGMGVVYAAEDTRLGRPVALKFVPDDLAKDGQAIERLRSEARTASALNHANICTIYDIGEHEGRPFIVMELLKGQTLRERLGAGRLKIHEIVDIAIQVADALDSAHRSDIIHRDIKPANLFLTDRGPLKILDFGLAKLLAHPSPTNSTGPTRDLTADGVTLGTVSYMSPEQVSGEQLDRRTDLFSLGVVLYECLTGRQPFTGKTSAVVFLAILNRAPVAPVVFNPDVPPRLQDVVHNCLEKDRELRYQDAAGLRADLRRIRRDLESGHSGVMRVVAADKTGPDRAGSDAEATRVSPAITSPHASSGSARTPSVGPSTYGVLIAVGALVIVVLYLVPWLVRKPPESAPPARLEAPVVRSQLDLAAKSLEERNYRAARAYSEDVLRVVPNDPEAVRIHDAAVAMIRRFDEAITSATGRLAAGDTDGATSALNVARGIDPAAPAVSDLSARLVTQLLKVQGDAQRREPPRSGATSAAAQRATSEPPQSGAARERPAAEPPKTVPPAALPPPAPAQVPVAAAPPPPAATPSVSTGAPPIATPAPVSVRPVPPEPDPPAVPQTTPPVETAAARRAPAPVPPRTVEDDDTVIGRVLETYRRAIETKDMALLRSVKPNLSAQEQRGIEEALRDMRSLQVTLSNVSIERRGDEASVRLRRRDSILAGGRRQATESQQVMTLVRNGGTWVIRDFGR